MKLCALSALAACQTFFTWIPAGNSHELLSRHFPTLVRSLRRDAMHGANEGRTVLLSIYRDRNGKHKSE